jgi:hypothetical protein
MLVCLHMNRGLHPVQLSASGLERFLLVADDLRYFLDLPKDRLLTRTEVRLSASVLRRLLIDDGGELFKVWKEMALPPPASMTVEAPSIDHAIDAWPAGWVRFAFAGGASLPGAHHTGIILAEVPETEWRPYGSPETFFQQRPLPLSGQVERAELRTWLEKQTSIAVNTAEFGLVRFSRQSVISYAANRRGGVHFDPNRTLDPKTKDAKQKRAREAQVLDQDLARVGSLWGYEFEIVSYVHALAATRWAREMVRMAQTQSPMDFSSDVNTVRLWTGQLEADGTRWVSFNIGQSDVPKQQ